MYLLEALPAEWKGLVDPLLPVFTPAFEIVAQVVAVLLLLSVLSFWLSWQLNQTFPNTMRSALPSPADVFLLAVGGSFIAGLVVVLFSILVVYIAVELITHVKRPKRHAVQIRIGRPPP
jgi:TRAP-type C4-dicarboxylate transport system permease small subunit